MAGDESIRPVELQLLSGDEVLGPATVRDFWRWALGDLRMNNARGYLVEFLVAQALGDPSPMRVEWGSFDVQAADGTRVEVKTTGRLQSWTLKKLSTPTWNFKSVRAKRVWSEDRGDYEAVDPDVRVHVWIFALQTALDPALYDPLNFLEQWVPCRASPPAACHRTDQRSACAIRTSRHLAGDLRGAARRRGLGSSGQRRSRNVDIAPLQRGERASRWTSPGHPLGTTSRRAARFRIDSRIAQAMREPSSRARRPLGNAPALI